MNHSSRILFKSTCLLLFPCILYGNNKKNVLFIAVDDLRTATGSYDDPYAITPNMDELAGKGFTFRRAYCQQAVSSPSRASFLTGLRPDQIGVTDLSKHFRTGNPCIVTLPQYFMNAGYQAECIGKIFHGSPRTQDSLSWSVPEKYNLSLKKEEYLLPVNRHGGKAAAIEVSDNPVHLFEDGKITDEVLLRLNHFGQTGEPFFLAVGFKKPHLPFAMPQKYWDMYPETFAGPVPWKGTVSKNIPPIALHRSEELRGYADMPDTAPFTDTQTRELIQAYYACVTFIDDQVGRLLDELKKTGLDKNTIIVLFSDHGFHLGEQDIWCKSTNFEIACKVPLLIYDPALEQYSTDISSIVELVDLYPTLLDMCGLAPKPGLAGESLLPLMINREPGKDIAFSQFPRPYNAIHSSDRQTHMGYTVRTPDWRYTVWYELATGSIVNKELYYLPGNILEVENMSGNHTCRLIETELLSKIEAYKNKNYEP